MTNADKYNLRQIQDENVVISHFTELTRQFQLRNGLLADGMCGPSTLSTLEELMYLESEPEGGWPMWLGPLPRIPTNRTEYYEIFGNPGVGSLNKRWFAENIVELHQSHGNELPMVPPHRYIKCHQKVEPYVREAWRRAQISCPDYEVERFGMFVFRHMNYDPRRPLSTHAFGAAGDIDPHKNRAVRFAPGKAPLAWSDEWMEIWPDGLPQGIVHAFESCWFEWGGRWQNFKDPMHMQLNGPEQVAITTPVIDWSVNPL